MIPGGRWRIRTLVLGDIKGAPADMLEHGLGRREVCVALTHGGNTKPQPWLLFRQVVDVVLVNLVAVV